jgi:hypothetical protein
VFHWKKHGKVFDPQTVTGKPWIHEFAQGPATLVFDEFIRVFFSCRPKPDEIGRYVSYSAYVDFDRNNLFKILRVSSDPILPLGDLGTFDEFGVYPVSVIRDGDRCLAYYGGWTRCESVPFNVAIGCAESHDGGSTFSRLGKGPVLSYSYDEPFILSGPKIRKFNDLFYLFYIAGRRWVLLNGKVEPVYKIRLATSCDGLIWEKSNRDMITDILGEDEAQASPDVLFFNGKYHMFFCYRQATDYRRNRERSYRIGYASSEDLLNWVRDDCQAGMDVSDQGWDSEMVAYPHVFELDGKIYMYYLGNEVGRHGFGLAELIGF